ncbi:MAG: ABC-F type ribosomal protection protein [Clostridia bacterium]|nr:ABC-F type ribosomal protection protein [Clostridia bacterium]
MLISGSGVSKSFSGEKLFENASFHIDDNERIGFVGPNGAGKTTFFRILLGLEAEDGGELFRSRQLKIGYLDQYSCADSERSVFDEVLEIYSHVIDIEHELEDIRFELESGAGDTDALILRQNELNEKLSETDGFFFRTKIKSTLIGLGFTEEDFSKPVSTLSGGQKTRVELAKILLSESDLLLLDEPTNHLDIKSVEWLEDFLRGYKGAFIVISHDRYFLDKVTNKTFELSGGRFYSFNGNYSAYAAQKEIDELTQSRQYENTMKEINRLEDVIKQQRQWNREKNIKTAESKQKVVDRLREGLEAPPEKESDISFSFKAYEGGGNDVIETKGLSKSFDGREIFENVNFDIKKGEKIFLLGPNGCGKTTLLKIILGICSEDSGAVKIGTDIHIGYYDQIQENLSPEKTVIDEVWDEYPRMTQTEIRNALAAFLFRGEDVFKLVGNLSGGERARVLLVKLMLKRVNLLIMDEPTNHLDINSREALEKALSSYGGTMLMVSHDRYFINKLSDRILYMLPDRIINSPGSYDEFNEKYGAAAAADIKNQPGFENNSAISYKEKKQRESERRKVMSRAKKAEDKIDELEKENEALNRQLLSPEIASDYIAASEITDKISANEEKLIELMEEWESLCAQIEHGEL